MTNKEVFQRSGLNWGNESDEQSPEDRNHAPEISDTPDLGK